MRLDRWTVLLALLAMTLGAGSAVADDDLPVKQKPIPVLLTLGSKDGKMTFEPKRLTFQIGKLYKLLLVNVGPVKHEFDSAAFAEAVYTYQVEIVSPDGEELAEIVGAIREVEVGPGATAEWYFVPMRPVKDGEIVCDLPGHREAGMTASFTIE